MSDFVVPTPDTTVIDDQQLALFIQITVAGITGIPGKFVRPRWQPNPPTQPPAGTNWIAVGVMERIPTDYPCEFVNTNGTLTQSRWETLDVLASFYGPNAGFNSSQLRDGLYIAQNRELLGTYGIRLRDVGSARTVPELVATSWLNRVDMPISLVRQLDRTYAILEMLSANIEFQTEAGALPTVTVELQ